MFCFLRAGWQAQNTVQYAMTDESARALFAIWAPCDSKSRCFDIRTQADTLPLHVVADDPFLSTVAQCERGVPEAYGAPCVWINGNGCSRHLQGSQLGPILRVGVIPTSKKPL